MRTLLLLLLLGLVVSAGQNPLTTDPDSPVAVVSFKWSKTKLTLEQATTTTQGPAPAMTFLNKNFERNRRANTSPGERDPNLDTVDGRAAALERSVQESRAPKPVDGFIYRTKVKNAGAKTIEVLFWEYQFQDPAEPTSLRRHQFLCGVSMRPEKDKELLGFSLASPSEVISVESLKKKTANALQEKVVVNRVEYSDGSIWQRQGWSFGEIKSTYNRALQTPWAPDMCKGL